MIRVNLLPVEKARRRSAGKLQLVIFGLIFLVELLGLGALYMATYQKVADLQADVRELDNSVQKKKKKVENTGNYQDDADRLRQKLEILREIEAKSIGPIHVLEDLQTILSEPRNSEERHTQKNDLGWNLNWDPRNLWIETLKESDGSFELVGKAMDADDVAEFLTRLGTSEHFQKIKLDYVRPADEKSGETQVVEFRVTGQMRYEASSAQNTSSKGS